MPAEDREALLADVEAYCRALRPIEDDCYLGHRRNDAIIDLAKSHDLLGIIVPREYGGRGADAMTYARALARINREGVGVRTFFSCQTSLGQYAVIHYGSDEQKSQYLPPSCAGDCIFAFGLTEPEAGSNPLQGQAVFREDTNQPGRSLLNGQKYLISNASIAHAAIVFAFPEGDDGSPARGGRMSAFIVDTEGETFDARPLPDKPGLYTSDTAQFRMTDHPVPHRNRLGAEGDGFRIAMHTLISGRLSVAAGCLGTIEDCLEAALSYSRARQQHGKAIGRHQLVQDHIAMIEMARATTEAMVERAARAKLQSDASPENSALRAEADFRIAQAKFHASNAAWDAADRAVQVFGGRGWLEGDRPMRHLQDVRVCRIYEGTDEIMKLKIASCLLGKEFEAFR